MATLVSLAWQFVIWHWSGARIKVDATPGAVFGGGQEAIAAIVVEANNKGRSACEVSTWYFETLSKDKLFTPQLLPGSGPRPAKLEGLHSLTWYIPQASLKEAAQRGDVTRLRPVVAIGSGKRFNGKWQAVSSLTRHAR